MSNLWRDKRLWLLVLLGMMSLAVGIQHNRAVREGAVDPFAEAVMAVLRPVQVALRATSGWISDFGYGVLHGRQLRQENERLRRQIEALISAQTSHEEVRQENERLRRLLGYVRKQSVRPVVARVLAIQPSAYFHTLLLDKGRADGVRTQMVALTDQGVVGVVYTVTENTSHVLLLTDPKASVGARIQRAESRAVGVCRGRGDEYLLLTFLSKDADVRVGDVVVTSGLGGVYPAGIPIGVVERVREQLQAGMREALVKPFVHFWQLEEVLLVRAGGSS